MDMIYKEMIKSRKEQGLSVMELAEKSGCSFKSIYLWESGKGNISFSNAQKVLKALSKEIAIVDLKEDNWAADQRERRNNE